MIGVSLIIELMFPLALMLSTIGLWKNSHKWRTYLPMFVYVLFIGAYCYTPMNGSNVDLVRYFPEIEAYGQLTLKEALTYNDDILFARDILFWICGKLQVPHLVPAITTATVYGVAGYITCDTAERYNYINHIGLILIVQFFMLPYFSIINNIRNVFGFSLIILAAYLDIIKKRKGIFIWFCYVAGGLMHLSCFVLVVFRVLCKLAEKMFEVLLFFPVVFSSIIFFIYNNRALISIGGSLGSSIQLIIRKLYIYLTNSSSAYALKVLDSRAYMANRLLMMAAVFLGLVLIYYGIRYNKSYFHDDKRFYVFSGMIAMMTLANNVFVLPNYWRFAAAYYVVFGFVIIPFLTKIGESNLLVKLLTKSTIAIAPLGLLIQLWQVRGFDFKGWGLDMLLTNYLTIAFQVFKGLFA